jgi:hypothetical protein
MYRTWAIVLVKVNKGTSIEGYRWLDTPAEPVPGSGCAQDAPRKYAAVGKGAVPMSMAVR